MVFLKENRFFCLNTNNYATITVLKTKHFHGLLCRTCMPQFRSTAQHHSAAQLSAAQHSAAPQYSAAPQDGGTAQQHNSKAHHEAQLQALLSTAANHVCSSGPHRNRSTAQPAASVAIALPLFAVRHRGCIKKFRDTSMRPFHECAGV